MRCTAARFKVVLQTIVGSFNACDGFGALDDNRAAPESMRAKAHVLDDIEVHRMVIAAKAWALSWEKAPKRMGGEKKKPPLGSFVTR